METYTTPKAFVDDPHFGSKRKEALDDLDPAAIDAPILDLIEDLSRVPYCFTLQCCWGHFVHDGQPDDHGLGPLAHYSPEAVVTYRIAYIALCLQPTEDGRRLFDDLRRVARIDPRNIQFGGAEWFWERRVNSYVLQAEPERFRFQDTALLDVREALEIQSARDRMFEALREIGRRHAIGSGG